MPTIYRPNLDHTPLKPKAISKAIRVLLKGRALELIKFARGDAAIIEQDEIKPFKTRVMEELFWFVANCVAHPIRSQNKVVATLLYIAKYPERFISRMEVFDPAAANALEVVYSKMSSAHHAAVLQFEIGQGTLSAEDVRKAALIAIEGYKKRCAERRKIQKGAPRNYLQRDFAERASRLFVAAGGMPTSTDAGRFRKFVELLRLPVKDAAVAAGCALNPVSIIRLAAKMRSETSARRV